ncbi:hypothetical protein BD560DRAFT_381945 [Blakeslea trispora]|nr:hypothetical protein BD560DRAFT_381945 [Blakeslea trispora]
MLKQKKRKRRKKKQDKISRVVKDLVTNMASSNISIVDSSKDTFTRRYLKPAIDEILIKKTKHHNKYMQSNYLLSYICRTVY